MRELEQVRSSLLKSGLTVAPTCSTCLGSHDVASVKGGLSRVSKSNSVETCGKCHQFIVSPGIRPRGPAARDHPRRRGSAHGDEEEI